MSVSVPPTPSNLAVQQGNGQVLVSWDQISGITSYDVQRSDDNITFASIAAPTSPEYLDTSVTEQTRYWYRVAAVNGDGFSEYTSSIMIIPCQSGLMSLYELRQKARQRADKENSDFVTDAELNGYINQSAYELYDLLTTAFEDYYAADPLTITTDGSSNQYDLPNGTNYNGARPFYKILGVDMGPSSAGNAWVTVHNFNFISRNRYVFPNVNSTYLGVFNLRYRIFGNTIYFIPTPSGGQYLRIWYIPRMEQMLQDTDVCDGINGWTEYVITDAAIKILQKEDSDVSVLALQKQTLIERIQTSSQNRDAGEPNTISDTRREGGLYGFGPGGDGAFGGY